ncbi:alcohol dehydrogenase catalytic domain-containing protein [Propionicicella superfundia]|uniref:alcohol dehydrogenase catalytic domain-containing protein n=1 Tax=Propionicicella superfundia TaxID=348582 RepID=UPI0003F5B27A|nr:alcohol dehydrogenase catalytic domain-containing protein [Propionicicella superfundia]
MRAIVYDAVGEPPRLTEMPAPVCAPGGAVIDVTATGICRSDWHAWRGHDPVPLPMIPGHEFAGVVAAVGEGVTRFAPGDRVTAPFVNACGRCAWCLAGQAQVCPQQTQPGFTHPGSYAEQVAVRAADFNLVQLPDAVDDVAAASLGCRFATAYHALTAQSRLAAGEWLLVVGCGGVGLSAILIAAALGARIVAADPSPAARARALDLGATTVLPVADPDVLADLTGGGVHVSLDAVGSPATAAACVGSLRRRGRHVQVGLMLAEDAVAPLAWGDLVSRELEIVGSHGMAASDYPGLLELIAGGRLDPHRLVGRVIDLAGAGDALMAMDAPAGAEAGLTVATVTR